MKIIFFSVVLVLSLAGACLSFADPLSPEPSSFVVSVSVDSSSRVAEIPIGEYGKQNVIRKDGRAFVREVFFSHVSEKISDHGKVVFVDDKSKKITACFGLSFPRQENGKPLFMGASHPVEVTVQISVNDKFSDYSISVLHGCPGDS